MKEFRIREEFVPKFGEFTYRAIEILEYTEGDFYDYVVYKYETLNVSRET